jgi:hypothetical protein
MPAASNDLHIIPRFVLATSGAMNTVIGISWMAEDPEIV